MNQGVGPDHEMDFPCGNGLIQAVALPPLDLSLQQADCDPHITQPPFEVEVVLLRQDLGGGHHCRLIAVVHGDEGGEQRHCRLAAPHIPLQQAVHGVRLGHIPFDLFEHPLLGLGEGKREPLQECVCKRCPCDAEGDPLFAGNTPAPQRHAELEEKELLKGQTLMGTGCLEVEPHEIGIPLRKVDLAHGLGKRHEVALGADPGRDRAVDLAVGVLHHLMHDPPDPALIEPLGLGIDRDDAPEVKGVPLRTFYPFQIGMHDLSLGPIPFDLPTEDNPITFFEASFDITDPLEPLRGDKTAPVPQNCLKDTATALRVEHLVGNDHLGQPDTLFADGELRDTPDLAAVFIPEGKVIEGIFDSLDTLFFEQLGDLRSYPFDVLHGGVEKTGHPSAGRGGRLLHAGNRYHAGNQRDQFASASDPLFLYTTGYLVKTDEVLMQVPQFGRNGRITGEGNRLVREPRDQPL